MSKYNILLKVSGSIAAYKVVDLASQLIKKGHNIKVVGTPNAKYFIGPATWEGITNSTYTDDTFQPGEAHQHIQLQRWADIIVLAPATATTINKLASGISDNLVTNLFLAHDFNKPYIIAPAMNDKMYSHPATQNSIKKLTSWGLVILEPGYGSLACGEIGKGRMIEPDLILKEIESQLKLNESNDALKVLITSGGTRESIDDVRSITNSSTGKTGAQLADYIISLGHKVTYIHSENAILPKSDVKKLKFSDFLSLKNILYKEISTEFYDTIYHVAAVSDYSLINSLSGKLPSDSDTLNLQLKKNEKIVDSLKNWSLNPNIKLIAFKLTSTQDPELKVKAVTDLFTHSKADWIIHNDVHDLKSGTPKYSIYRKDLSKAFAECTFVEDFAKKIQNYYGVNI